MEILQLVDQLEQVLNRGWRVPFSTSLVVNEEECLRLIDQMRISVPSSIKESDRMVNERDRILTEARRQAEEMLLQAEQEALQHISQHHIAQEARREANRIVAGGHEEAMRLVQDAEEYTLDVLRRLVAQLGSALHQAENGIEAIEQSRAEAEANPIEPELPTAVAMGFDPEPDLEPGSGS